MRSVPQPLPRPLMACGLKLETDASGSDPHQGTRRLEAETHAAPTTPHFKRGFEVAEGK